MDIPQLGNKVAPITIGLLDDLVGAGEQHRRDLDLSALEFVTCCTPEKLRNNRVVCDIVKTMCA